MGMFYVSMPKSKKRKVPKAPQAQHDEWVKSINSMSTNFSRTTTKKVIARMPLVQSQPVRQTPHYPSLNTGNVAATKPAPKVYTGDKVLGIATLHKSNAVPVFNSQEAVDISKMRR